MNNYERAKLIKVKKSDLHEFLSLIPPFSQLDGYLINQSMNKLTNQFINNQSINKLTNPQINK